MTPSSMKRFNRLGNWFFTVLIRNVYKVNVTDTLTGYFAWRREAIVKLRPHIASEGFAIEMEMITKQARLGFETYSVPITYAPRVGETSLKPIRDGIRILGVFLRQLSWKPSPGLAPQATHVMYPPREGVISPGFAAGRDASTFEQSPHPTQPLGLIPVEDDVGDPLELARTVWRAKGALPTVAGMRSQAHSGLGKDHGHAVRSVRAHLGRTRNRRRVSRVLPRI